ncbi:MAG: hypothetical protein IT318_12540, partial [Anaerolineales bacterium]|nr:hypothetical protein [Anaerolineales bacterium]
MTTSARPRFRRSGQAGRLARLCALAVVFWPAALAGAMPPPAPGAARPAAAAAACAPLPPPGGTIIPVDSVASLQAAVASLASNTTILIADGVYDLTQTLVIDGADNVAIRGASGNPEAVLLRGRGMSNANYGDVPHVVLVQDAADLLIADLTLRDAYFHLVQIQGEQGAQRPRLYNLRLIDSGEQFVKGSTAGPPGPYADGGLVACSTLEYTTHARSGYTNGVDVLAGADWVIRDNVFRNIRGPAGEQAGPAVLMWRNSLNTVVERNHFLECDRAIALGLAAPDGGLARDGNTTYDHQGGIVRNNFIYRAGAGDVGITVNYARQVSVFHNTVLLNGTFPWGAIEHRFGATSADIRYNLTDAPIWQRDGAAGTLIGNITTAQPGWFAGPGDLHLTAAASAALDQALPLSAVTDDFDGDLRPIGSAPDIGADEYGQPPPAAVSDLRVTRAVTASGGLTVTLAWTPPPGAMTATLRYSASLITPANWSSAPLLAGGLP